MNHIVSAIFISLFLLFSGHQSFCEETLVAKLDYNEIETLLVDFTGKDSKHKDIIQRYKEQKKFRSSNRDMVDRALEQGEMTFQDFAKKQLEIESKIDRNLSSQVELILQRKLLELINKKYPNKYMLIFNDNNFQDFILYNDFMVHDITTNIKKYLLEN